MIKLFEQIKYHYIKLFRRCVLLLQNFYVFKFKLVQNQNFKKIIKENREYLKSNSPFFTLDEFSVNDYGMSESIFVNINKPIKEFPTYSDILQYSSQFLNKKSIEYLEIGTSVMKNFYQMDNYFMSSKLIAYDINPIPKKYKHNYTAYSIQSNFKNSKCYVSDTDNELYYFNGSVLESSDFKLFNKLFPDKFDIVFSDALHTKEGVMSEYQNIIKNKLNDEFILYFDDLDFPELLTTASEIYRDLQGNQNKIYFTTFKTYGWVGQYERMHLNGFISSLDFYSIFKKNGISLPRLKKITQ